jgi:ADP-ribose pyrophosphatase YjhB (NUDIX family)
MVKISDGAKIFIKNEQLNKYIFILRDDKDDIPYPSFWDLAGGRIEEKETPLETIDREVEEELDIDVYDIEHLTSRNVIHSIKGKRYYIKGHYFIGKTDKNDLSDIVLTEGQDVGFFTIEEILSRENVIPIIKTLANKYPNRLK